MGSAQTENVTGKPKGKGAIPDESGRGLLKSHLRVAANDRNTRAGTGDCPKGGEKPPGGIPSDPHSVG